MSGTLPAWLERWFGIKPSDGEGTRWTLENEWPWRPSITLLLVAAAVIFVAVVYMRESRRASGRFRAALAVLRLALVVLAMLMIAQFSLSLERTGLPYVAVLVDDSLSMTTVDRYEERLRKAMQERVRRSDIGDGQLSRWNLAETLLTERDGDMLSQFARQPQAPRVPAHRRSAHRGEARRQDGRGRHRRAAQAEAARRRADPPGRRGPRRAGRLARHGAGGHRPLDRRHQHRRALVGRRGRLRGGKGRAAVLHRPGQRPARPRR